MRRFAVIMPAFALVTGVAGFFIRRQELATVFDPVSGLAEKNAPVTLALAGLSIAVTLVAIIFAMCIPKQYSAGTVYSKAFAFNNIGGLLLFVILGLGIIAASLMQWFSLKNYSTAINVSELVFIVFAIVTGISLIVMATGAFTGATGGGLLFCSVIPSLFLCFWLVMTYKANARNPVLIDYCYECLALITAALSFYFSAGFAYNKATPKRTVMSHLLAIYFCVVTLADYRSYAKSIIIGILIVALVVNVSDFIRNLKKVQPTLQESGGNGSEVSGESK